MKAQLVTPRSKLLFVCEGDAETRDAWSGSGNSVVSHLRERGHEVETINARLEGLRRYFVAALSFRPNRERWRSRFLFGERAYWHKSRQASRKVGRSLDDVDHILQIGATFNSVRGLPRDAAPLFLYCDANMAVAVRHASSGHSAASFLTEREVESAIRRESSVYSRAQRIFTISKTLADSFVDDFGVAPEKVTPVYAGANLASSDLDRVSQLRESRSSSSPTVLFVGKRFYRKGGDVLLSAFRRVRADVPDARLVIVGPENPVQEQDGVEWWGHLSKDSPEERKRLLRGYAEADVFCLPTRYEPFGVVFVEAMRFGLPCVGTRVGAVEEIIDDGRTGRICEREDTNQLAEALIGLLQKPEDARAMGRRGRARAERQFTWERVVGTISDLMLEQSAGRYGC